MGYQVLARKWRPGNFSEMVGQTHVLRAITNALDNDRLHHAYLFTGTRGVGKTTIARIFAKSLNCEKGISSTPCGQCGICQEINDGRFVDLIEVDAASRTKVEDTRELLDNVQYAATRGRYKVYLIDEVHMLSTHSFNALLKTLEEPPPHVKFLLATTDPQKLPVTILSRCLQFNLKRLPPELIQEHLRYVLTEEKIEAENSALKQLARSADGSMRDALSLLDQAIAYSGGQLTTAQIHEMLGTIEQTHVLKLVQALAENSGEALLNCIQQLAEQAPDFNSVLADLIDLLYRVALQQTVRSAFSDDEDNKDTIEQLAENISPQDIQLYYQIALIGRRDLPLSPDLRTGFEMIMLRMLAFRPASASNTALTNPEPNIQPAPASPDTKIQKSSTTPIPQSTTSSISPAKQAIAAAKALTEAKPSKQKAPLSKTSPPVQKKQEESETQAPPLTSSDDWHTIVESLKLSGLVQQLALNSLYKSRDGNTITLQVDRNGERLRSPQMIKRLEEALQSYFNTQIKLVFESKGSIQNESILPHKTETPAMRQQREANERLEIAKQSISNDPNIKELQNTFNARVVTDSIKPLL